MRGSGAGSKEFVLSPPAKLLPTRSMRLAPMLHLLRRDAPAAPATSFLWARSSMPAMDTNLDDFGSLPTQVCQESSQRTVENLSFALEMYFFSIQTASKSWLPKICL